MTFSMNKFDAKHLKLLLNGKHKELSPVFIVAVHFATVASRQILRKEKFVEFIYQYNQIFKLNVRNLQKIRDTKKTSGKHMIK